jgi:hypothetical protein
LESRRGPQQGLDTTFRRTWDNAISLVVLAFVIYFVVAEIAYIVLYFAISIVTTLWFGLEPVQAVANILSGLIGIFAAKKVCDMVLSDYSTKLVFVIMCIIFACVLGGIAIQWTHFDWDRIMHIVHGMSAIVASILVLWGVRLETFNLLSVVPLTILWMLAGPVTYILNVVETWRGPASVPVKLLVSVTLDAFLAGIWPVTWVIWAIESFGFGHSTPLDLLFARLVN